MHSRGVRQTFLLYQFLEEALHPSQGIERGREGRGYLEIHRRRHQDPHPTEKIGWVQALHPNQSLQRDPMSGQEDLRPISRRLHLDPDTFRAIKSRENLRHPKRLSRIGKHSDITGYPILTIPLIQTEPRCNRGLTWETIF